MDLTNLIHVDRPLPGGGRVVVLNTGAVITPEAEAMLQALHSRSIGGVYAHLTKLQKRGTAADFMSTYYVGYGDKSIGDCGSTTIFIEGVSTLVAKAIQDSQLYNGQESSTRYIDFSLQPFVNPHGSPEGYDLLESLRAFHLEGLSAMKATLIESHPLQEGEDEVVWRKAISARAFDIMRGFLPAGVTTNLAWHTELRHAADHLLRLRNHPLEEVRGVAVATHEALNEAYPNSFKQKRYDKTEVYTSNWMRSYYLDAGSRETLSSGVRLEQEWLDYSLLATQYVEILSMRPEKTEPPKFLAECGGMRFSFPLDFGSFRDMQRHRALIQRMPLLTHTHGFESWYLDHMPPKLRRKAIEVLEAQRIGLNRLNLPSEYQQYYVPMGYRVSCRITGDLPALIWFVELRSGTSVHPTLRIVAQEVGWILLDKLGRFGLKLYINWNKDRFNIKRGTHDIVEK